MVHITTTKQISWDCVQVTLSMGSSFFIRTCYLQLLPVHEVVVGRELSDEEVDDLVTAGLTFAAEKAAVNYLERAEQSRYLLTIKLKKKEHTEGAISKALDYLEERGFLSDVRYAQAWLRNRSINHTEGRNRLLSGLLAKGINRKIISEVLDEYFESVSQDDVLERAIEKCHRLGKSQEATEKYLLRKGFSYKEMKSKMSKI